MASLRLFAVFLAVFPFAQTAEVDVVLDRAGDYVAAYERTFVGVVAEETYRQEVRGITGTDSRGFPADEKKIDDQPPPIACTTSMRSSAESLREA